MSYETAEAALLVVIRKADGFNAGNTSAGDYRILAKGNRKAVVLNPGPFTKTVTAAPRRMGYNWVVNTELFVPFEKELSVVALSLRRVRQDLMDIIDQYPNLASTANIIDSFLEGGSEPDLWQGENRRWWTQRMRVVIKERATITILE